MKIRVVRMITWLMYMCTLHEFPQKMVRSNLVDQCSGGPDKAALSIDVAYAHDRWFSVCMVKSKCFTSCMLQPNRLSIGALATKVAPSIQCACAQPFFFGGIGFFLLLHICCAACNTVEVRPVSIVALSIYDLKLLLDWSWR